MGAYLRGNSITVVQRFNRVDPVTEVAALFDPTTVSFTLQDPDGVETVYEFGVDLEVTKPSVGIYLLALTPPLPTGMYSWASDGASPGLDPPLVAHGEGTFTILPSGVLAPDAPGVAEYGPCSPWISGQDVLDACAGTNLGTADAFKLDTAASIGQSAMWDLLGRQFDGICERTVRPTSPGCGCFGGDRALGLGPWWWQSGFWVGEWGGFHVGCGTCAPKLLLAGYPVREILEVKIDGAVVSSALYRLDGHRELVYLTDHGPPVTRRLWPGCQDTALADDQPGTFSVRYSWGAEPPELAKAAAAQIGCEVYKALQGGDCKLPARATKVVRQGVTIDRAITIADAWKKGSTGLPLVDLAIATLNPTGMRRAPAVYKLDGPGFPQTVGQ